MMDTSTSQSTILRTEILRITYRNEENGFTVFRARDPASQREITVAGSMLEAAPGQLCQLYGSWREHSQYGRQFQVDRAVAMRPTSREGIAKYLASGILPGVGATTAERLARTFGPTIFEILDKDPDKLKGVPGFGRKRLATLREAWLAHKDQSEVMMFLSRHGITPAYAARIIRAYGKATIDLVSSNPYRLADEIHGIGFKIADRIALELGIRPNSELRIGAAIQYLLAAAQDQGDCYMTTDQLLKLLRSSIDIDDPDLDSLVAERLAALNTSGRICSEPHPDGGQTIHYSWDIHRDEVAVASAIRRLAGRKIAIDRTRIQDWLRRYAAQASLELTPQQTSAISRAAETGLFVLTGGPGVGKTTTANAIIRLFKAMGHTVALAAPTGRAAQRLHEISAVPAKTLHRLLEWNAGTGTFQRNAENPIAARVVIVDEVSMLDIQLGASLVRALHPDSQLVLIGDADQLPAVGPGNVLRDILRCPAVPSLRLTEVFRQAAASHIIQAAHAFNQGLVPAFFAEPTGGQTDCLLIPRPSPQEIAATILEQIQGFVDRLGLDPIRDIQVLSPMKRGDVGTEALNTLIQDRFNPQPAARTSNTSLRFRPGDKVIQTVNNYDLGIFNGDIGIVEHTGVQGKKTLVQFGEGRLVEYKDDQVDALRLAYAITIHKSQGSEFPVVLIPVTHQHHIMLQRNLIYTALTRARKYAVLIGTMDALRYAVREDRSRKRQTALYDRIICQG